jgi:hypothetical protein
VWKANRWAESVEEWLVFDAKPAKKLSRFQSHGTRGLRHAVVGVAGRRIY